ncbi:SusC/RagA family TonB-linked outer membrane protein [Pedobacter sp. HMF7647]|uniref:SusC/RagA family TonB-linked outer membrane protein n=1 Tax=Hufsiella arboris TaxID=2695275 RepID=A0A7K1YF11_9SPHI|nr:SusC/RagA family TonB-linked outer membrane protein [Hufsiella arboris]MXV53193.1 SusC/RagA family TonB-linked outer membrane protein [Hufsiella arboris]
MKFLLKVSFFMICYAFAMSVQAQNRVVEGKVTDRKDNSPLIGVSVIVKGATTGTRTDANGAYRLSVPTSAQALIFTYLGYERQEVAINSRTTINASLSSSSTSLNEVVVVGYGTQRVRDATGAVASIGTKDFNKGVIASPEQLLQGRVPGVQVTPASGEPGAGININIRGATSIRSNNNPLFVIDGVPLDASGPTTGGMDAGAGMSSARNPLSFLNPADIENISVLKDASAAAIYGSRGANGVVLITTKKGTKGQGLTFIASGSMSSAARTYDLLNTQDFLNLVARTGANNGPISQGGINFGSSNDWQDAFLRNAYSQSYNLGYGGAKGGTQYRLNFGYDDINGIVKNSGLKRLSGRLNASQSLLKDKLKLDLTFTASNVKNQYAPITNTAGFEGSLIGSAIIANPTYPLYNSDGSYFTGGSSTYRNPVNMLNEIDDSDDINRYLGNLGATLNVIKNLSYRGTIGYDYSKGARETWMSPLLIGYSGTQRIRDVQVEQVTGRGRGITQDSKLQNLITEHTLTYNNKFGNNTFTALGGYSYQTFKNSPLNYIGWGNSASTASVKDINAFPNHLPAAYGDSTKSELQSVFTRLNYAFKDKLYLTFTMRADGSSKFGENNKYGFFPSGAIKWRVVDTNTPNRGIFNDFSLRLNYGLTGSQDGIPPYASLTIRQLQQSGAITTNTIGNPDLKWETTTSYGAGIDFGVFEGRLTGTLDYFNKSTKDLLFQVDLPAPSPINNGRVWSNIPGKLVNSGVELGLNVDAVRQSKFTWQIAYNFTYLKNQMKDFSGTVITGDISGQGLSGAYSQLIRNGYPAPAFFLPSYSGLDANGFGIYPNGADVSTYQGSPIPRFTQGLTNSFTFGRFNASFFLNAATGFVIYNNTANAYFLRGSFKNGRNVTYDVAESNENTLNPGGVSTRFLEKGDFLRLANANIGYTFNLQNSKAIKRLNLTLSGQNVFLITNYSGIDPEINTDKSRDGVPSRGIDYAAYPTARSFTLSLNAGF